MSPCIAAASTPRAAQLLGEPVGAALRAHEDEGEPPLLRRAIDQPIELVRVGHSDELVLDGAVVFA